MYFLLFNMDMNYTKRHDLVKKLIDYLIINSRDRNHTLEINVYFFIMYKMKFTINNGLSLFDVQISNNKDIILIV